MTSYEFETHRPVDLFVEIGSGTVQIQTTDTTESHVEINGRDADRATVEQDGDRLSVVAPRHRTGFSSGEAKLDFLITVPTRSELTVRSGSAEVTARGAYGVTHVKSGSGEVQIESLEGQSLVETGSGGVRIEASESDLRVKSGSGDIAIERCGGALSVSTGSGDVQIGTNNGPAMIKTGSGDLKVAEARTDVAMTTGSGDLVIGSASNGRFSVKGASSDVRIGVPAGVPVWTDLSTISGQIRSDLAGAGEPEEGADYVELRAKTVSGDIVLTQI
ncbi:MAG: DUF4097 family beta strand repeat-containing protein [Nocardioides sp.]